MQTLDLEIPQPKPSPVIGNLPSIDPKNPVQNLMRLAKEYGPIFRLELPGRVLTIVSSYELVDELSDETRFDKKVWRPLRNVRNFTGDGLFTAYTQENNWSKAHNILLPNFSQRAMQGYHPMMLDIAEQLMLKWERLNAGDQIDVVHDMTALTLDTIGLCGFDYRFNSYYRETAHPFVNAMVGALGEEMAKLSKLRIQNKLRVNSARRLQRNIDFMFKTVDGIIKDRRENGSSENKSDLLSYMLSGVDKNTGERLSDENIRYQIITFLIAGHETTSGLLSFALYFLLNNPEVLQKAYAEVDSVLGTDLSVKPTYAQVNRLNYIQQVLKETLRMWPTAPLFALYPYEETIIGGKYRVKPTDELAVLIPTLHRDKAVWGERADIFDPENFSREAERNRPANAFKPFGNGQRACIGRQFALQEATLVLGMLLQRFSLRDANRYNLKVKETLTLKPENFFIKIQPRTNRVSSSAPVALVEKPGSAPALAATAQHGTPLLVLHGSNLGTAEDLAHKIARAGTLQGYATQVASLDDYAGSLPTNGAVIISTASYNGAPPDNAAAFCRWLNSGKLGANSLRGVNYTVFGCGNRDWAATFQAIPRLIDSKLAEFGANRIYPRGEGDASDDFDGQFESWINPLWQQLAPELGIEFSSLPTGKSASLYRLEVVQETSFTHSLTSSYGAQLMTVTANRELQNTDSGRSTRHIEIALPEGVSYKAGDHLGVVARNSTELVGRVARRFGFSANSQVRLQLNQAGKTNLPLDEALAVYDLLANYVELQEVATRAQIKTLAEYTECPPEKMKLLAFAADTEAGKALYRNEIFLKRRSVLDLLEEFAACELPFAVYLEMVPGLKPRYYSISSSPVVNPQQASITVAVVADEARSGQGTFKGVCSNYLLEQPAGSRVYAFVRDNNVSFGLPTDATTPLILVGPGTGLAPFRGFLQERQSLKESGATISPTLLFFGCRHPEQDYLYETELKEFEQNGVAKIHTAFSRLPGQPKIYVQDLLTAQAEEVWELLEAGAAIYICGDAGQMAPAVRQTFAKLYREKTGATEAAAEKWLTELSANRRYQTDVWASS